MSPRTFGHDTAATAPENYERFFVPSIGAPLASVLVDAAELKPGEEVLDVACGTGIVARLASPRVGSEGRVVGVDMSPGMLAVARATQPVDQGMEWHEAAAEGMPLRDGRFDAVLCQMGLQFMEDRGAALREMRRVLKEGGRLRLNVPGPAPRMFEILARAMGRHIALPASDFVLQVFSLHDAEELRRLLVKAGFKGVEVAEHVRKLPLPTPRDFLRQYVHATPLAGIVSGAENKATSALADEVVLGWRPFTEDGGMMLSLRVVTVSAWK